MSHTSFSWKYTEACEELAGFKINSQIVPESEVDILKGIVDRGHYDLQLLYNRDTQVVDFVPINRIPSTAVAYVRKNPNYEQLRQVWIIGSFDDEPIYRKYMIAAISAATGNSIVDTDLATRDDVWLAKNFLFVATAEQFKIAVEIGLPQTSGTLYNARYHHLNAAIDVLDKTNLCSLFLAARGMQDGHHIVPIINHLENNGFPKVNPDELYSFLYYRCYQPQLAKEVNSYFALNIIELYGLVKYPSGFGCYAVTFDISQYTGSIGSGRDCEYSWLPVQHTSWARNGDSDNIVMQKSGRVFTPDVFPPDIVEYAASRGFRLHQ